MVFREATATDIPQMQVVRHAVKENVLSNPALVTDAHVEDYILSRGKGWVCEVEGTVVGFAIVDLVDHNIWALFVHPGQEKKGIGKTLHDQMLDWYFSQTTVPVWLGTSPGTRAETFYRTVGWQEAGTNGPKEIRFEMTVEDWRKRQAALD
jgi:GNAT superfamily N-acetyltransferase